MNKKSVLNRDKNVGGKLDKILIFQINNHFLTVTNIHLFLFVATYPPLRSVATWHQDLDYEIIYLSHFPHWSGQ